MASRQILQEALKYQTNRFSMNLFKPWKSHFYVLLLHPADAKVLRQTNYDQYGLPVVEVNQHVQLFNVEVIKATVEQTLGFAFNVLHYARYQINKKQRQVQGIYVLELLEPHPATQNVQVGTWCDRPTLEGLSFTNPSHQSIVENYLIELENESTPPYRPAWARLGWFREVSAWIEAQLEIFGYQQISPIQYVTSRSISCILKVETTGGTLFFKEIPTCLPLFCNEPRVTQALARLFPQHLPTILSIDSQHHRMLTADFGKPLGNQASSKMRQEIHRLFAQVQIQSIKHCDRLLNEYSSLFFAISH
ncbi:MAG: hypothetical protein F6J95_022250 [Leptolyngbya sp. SIO1E4]|nr:hypothetical protein [Leptolyngbya sp. SIO1E4]